MPMIYHSISRQCSIIFLFLNISKHRNRCVKVDYAFTEKTCYSQNFKLYGHSCIRLEDRQHVLCVLCVHMCICTCQYVYIPTIQPIKVSLDACNKQTILYSLPFTLCLNTVKPACNGIAKDQIFFHGRKLSFNTGT
jgi:hypothetical protein